MNETAQELHAAPHKPVMLGEMLTALSPRDGEVYVDATFGAGGYSRAILESAHCQVYAIDRDPHVSMLADALARDFPGRFVLLAGCFSEMVELLASQGIESVDGIVMDIGVSSMQLDQPERGFSFQSDGPLDMRMGARGVPASVLVNTLPEDELADVIYKYGEEKASRKIAKAIVEMRESAPIETTLRLADIIRSVVPRKKDADPATKTFQALRIAVNDELGELEKALEASRHLLKTGGRLVVVTFHSLEDRIVKQCMRNMSGYRSEAVSRHFPEALQAAEEGRVLSAQFILPKGQPIHPAKEEIAHNPRSRSAKLRHAVKAELLEDEAI